MVDDYFDVGKYMDENYRGNVEAYE